MVNALRADGNGSGLRRSCLLIRRLRALIEGEWQQTLTFEDLSRLTNQPKSTLCNWFNGEGEPSSETLLRLLELVPEAKRYAALGKPPFGRTCPQIDHPTLAHDPVATSYLRTIMSEVKGLTFVEGEKDALVTFVATALGRHVTLDSRCPREVIGIDLHAPDWFVPVPGLVYLNNRLKPEHVRKALDEIWPAIESSDGAVVMFNGIRSCVPKLLETVSKLTSRCHVIIADAKLHQSLTADGGVRHITISPDKNQPDRIRVEVRIT